MAIKVGDMMQLYDPSILICIAFRGHRFIINTLSIGDKRDNENNLSIDTEKCAYLHNVSFNMYTLCIWKVKRKEILQ